MSYFTEDFAIKSTDAAQVSAGTAFNSTIQDLAGVDEVTFLVSIGTANAGNGIELHHGDDAALSDAADVVGSAQLAKTRFIVTVKNPRKRYMRVSVIRAGANTTVDSIWCIKRTKTAPNNNVDSNHAVEAHDRPTDGTA